LGDELSTMLVYNQGKIVLSHHNAYSGGAANTKFFNSLIVQDYGTYWNTTNYFRIPTAGDIFGRIIAQKLNHPYYVHGFTEDSSRTTRLALINSEDLSAKMFSFAL